MNNIFIDTNLDLEIEYDSVKPESYDYESHNSKTDVEFNGRINLTSRGIDVIDFDADDQVLSFKVELQPDFKDETEFAIFKIKSKIKTSFNKENVDLTFGIYPKKILLKILELKKQDYDFIGKGEAELLF